MLVGPGPGTGSGMAERKGAHRYGGKANKKGEIKMTRGLGDAVTGQKNSTSVSLAQIVSPAF